MTRIQREQRTVAAMIRLYCRDHHGTGALCTDCDALLVYAMKRLEACPFGALKPTCSKCHIHCYKPRMREKVTTVMRYAGPRMIRHHPLMALRHLWDSFQKFKRHGVPR
ncbi:MAG: nitrous oxide-stimulated promoter family protein [Phycisphaeraceae bacterium]|nr:nitrous oxide-stimulated promoter family protein [Phycisphaeraceae bacterium]